MSERSVRQYSAADLEAVLAIFRSNIPKYFSPGEEQGLRDFLSDSVCDYYVIELDGEVIGAGGIGLNEYQPPTVSLCWGMIREDYLGRGLGKVLTEFRIDLARERYREAALVISTSQPHRVFTRSLASRWSGTKWTALLPELIFVR